MRLGQIPKKAREASRDNYTGFFGKFLLDFQCAKLLGQRIGKEKFFIIFSHGYVSS